MVGKEAAEGIIGKAQKSQEQSGRLDVHIYVEQGRKTIGDGGALSRRSPGKMSMWDGGYVPSKLRNSSMIH